MTVKELMGVLGKMPPGAGVRYMYDGIEAKPANFVWLSQSGHVILCKNGDPVYNNEDRPVGAPDEHGENIRDGHWCAGDPTT